MLMLRAESANPPLSRERAGASSGAQCDRVADVQKLYFINDGGLCIGVEASMSRRPSAVIRRAACTWVG
jgi:hypothetical protein